MEKTQEELRTELRAMKDHAQSIIIECDKWALHPDAVFRHGYAREKIERLLRILERNEPDYKRVV